jgi:hypothetical protein
VNDPLLDSLAFVGALVAVFVDQRRAVLFACVAVAVCLAPTAAALGGGWAALLLAVAAAATGLAGELAGRLRSWVTPRLGTGPRMPVAAAADSLFGPRSLRAVAALVALPAASWISFNASVGAVAGVQGLLFPPTFTFLCGAIRLLLARNVRDLAVGVAVVALAVAVGWFLRGGSAPLPVAAGVAVLAPVAAVVAEWLGGRDRPDRVPEGAG